MLRFYARDLFYILGGKLIKRAGELFEAFGALGDELLVHQPFLNDYLCHATEDRYVAARLERQPQLGVIDQLQAAWVDHDQLGPIFFNCGDHHLGDDRVVLGGVRTCDDEDVRSSIFIRVDQLGGSVAHRRRADRLLQGIHRAGMAQPGAVIDVIGAEERAIELLQHVIVLVGGFGADIHRQRLRSIPAVDLDQPVSHQIQRLVPRDRAPFRQVEGLCACASFLRRAAHQRSGHALLVIYKIVTEAPFDAQVAMVDWVVERRSHLVNVVVFQVQLQIAANAAVRADGPNTIIFSDHASLRFKFHVSSVMRRISPVT